MSETITVELRGPFYFVMYDSKTGEIVGESSSSGSPDPADFNWRDGSRLALAVPALLNQSTNYVDLKTMEVAPRPEMPTIIDQNYITTTEEAIIENVPENAVLTIDGKNSSVVTDGVVEFSAEITGVYTLDLNLFPYQPISYEVTVA